jgi:hypothetical protein
LYFEQNKQTLYKYLTNSIIYDDPTVSLPRRFLFEESAVPPLLEVLSPELSGFPAGAVFTVGVPVAIQA